MADHEDYLSGEAPMAHHESHESLGSDEISVAGLLGITAELAAHALIATAHQDAPALIAAHAAIAAAHHARYTDVEAQAIADAQIAIHAALPTVHQDAPALIATHTADASAHHAKYTDAEARALFNPISIPPPSFVPSTDTHDWQINQDILRSGSSLTTQYFMAPVIFPTGVTVTKLTLYGYRDDSLSTLELRFYRVHRLGGSFRMAIIISNWITGWSSLYDDDIRYSVVNNGIYSYALYLIVTPNDNVNDVKFSGAKIEFTG